MSRTLRALKGQLAVLTLALFAILGASNAQAQTPAYEIGGSTKYGGGSVTNLSTFSVTAIDSIEVKAVKVFTWTGSGGNGTHGTLEVWYKAGNAATACASVTGWTRVAQETRAMVYAPVLLQFDLDTPVVIPKGTTVTFGVGGDGAARTISGGSGGTDANSYASVSLDGYRGNKSSSSTQPVTGWSSGSKFQGRVLFDLAGADVTWVGNVSSNWNTAANWSNNKVPTGSDFVTIPSAATTANDPTVPSNGVCRDLIIETGGIVNGGAGSLDLKGKWENSGTFNKGTSTVTFSNSVSQLIDDPTNDFNILTISNGQAVFKNAVGAANTGTWIVNSGAELAFFGGNAVNISNIALTNNGTIAFGGPSNNQIVTTKADQALRGVTIDAPGSTDSVTLTGSQTFSSLLLKGNGDITFPGDIEFSNSFETEMGSTGSVTATSLDGTGDMTFDMAHSWTIPFSIGNNDITYTGAGSLTLTGSHTGSIEHDGNGLFTLDGDYNGDYFDFLGTGTMRITGDFDAFELTHDGSGSFTIDGDFLAGDIYLDGTGSLTIKGDAEIEALEMTGGTVFTADMAATVESLVQEGTGQLNFDGGLTLEDEMVLEPDQGLGTVNVDGDLSVDGDLTINPSVQANQNSLFVTGDTTIAGKADFLQSNARFGGAVEISGDVSITKEAEVDFNSSLDPVTLTKLTMSNNSKLNANALVTVEGLVSLNDSAKIDVDSDFTVEFHVNNQSTEKIEVGGIFKVDGSSALVPINLNLSDDIQAERVILDADVGVKLTGAIESTSTTLADPGMTVTFGTELELADEAELVIGAGFLLMNGEIISSAGATGFPAKIVGDNAPDEQGTVIFGATSTVNLDALIFERIGNSTQQYGIVFENGAEVEKFDYIRIPDSASIVAVIDLNTSDFVDTVEGLWIAGTSPVNIDAFDAFDITITINLSTTGGGSLYGDGFEQDPQKILFWDASAVVLIQTPAKITVGYVGRDYSYQIPVVGGNAPYAYSLANQPAWMSVNPLTGEIIGMPAAGDIGTDISFDIVVGDSTEIGVPPNTTPLAPVMQTVVIDVEFPPYFPIKFITESDLPDMTADVEYSTQIEIEDGREPYVFELVGAQSWLTIDSTSGEISGKAPLLFEGPISFTVRVSDDNTETPPVDKLFNMTVQPSGYQAITLTDSSDLPNLVEGNTYEETLGIEGGVAPFTFEFATAPEWQNTILQSGQENDDPANWLSIDPVDGVLSGTAPIGVYDTVVFAVRVTDNRAGSPAAVKVFSFDVVEIPYTPITITSPSLLPAVPQGQLFSYFVQAEDGRPAYDYSMVSAPIWLSIDAVSGQLTGIPPSTFSGFLNFSVAVGDTKPGVPPVVKNFALQVLRLGGDELLVNTPPLLFAAEAGVRYEMVLAASGGSGSGYVWSLRAGSELPAGLTLSSGGVISGTPAPGLDGDYVFDVRVVDSLGGESFQTLSLTVESASLDGTGQDTNITQGSLPDRGPAGGCAISGGSNLWLLMILAIFAGIFASRRTRQEA